MDKEEIVEKTWLSPREAELYLLKKEGKSLSDAAEEMGTTRGSVSSQWASLKQKIKKSQETADLLELPD
jgi:DNA-binding CsgD family transcriptional regulator